MVAKLFADEARAGNDGCSSLDDWNPFADAAAAGYPTARHARRPLTSAASWPHDIRNTIGVTPKSICIAPAWPDMATNKNDWQSASMN
jgi:hypothetical protein